MRYLPIVFLCTALFTGYGLKAQEFFNAEESTPLPDKIDGNWALPDCRNYEEALIITHHFYLKSTPQSSQLWLVESFGKAKDYWLLTMEGEKRPVKLEEDGILKIGILAGEAPAVWPKEWDALDLDRKREYMGCADAPSLLPIPLIRVMTYLDKVEEACSTRTMTESCKHLLFDILDDDKNKKLSLQEMSMAGAMLAGFTSLIENHSIYRQTLDRVFYSGLAEGEKIGRAMTLSGHDPGYKEFTGFLKKVHSPALQTALEKTGTLFPAFSAAAKTMVPAAPLPPAEIIDSVRRQHGAGDH